ncbi:Short C-terminal domain-containing protein [Flavobacteriaceae bacterium MAR_2010_188]|nr:Short C-terminal domain-containing protein [Flavobacteriaceae bacterium MAR_2010_188]
MKQDDIKKIYSKLDNYGIENIIRNEINKLPSSVYLFIRDEAIKRNMSNELLQIVDKKLAESNIAIPISKEKVVHSNKEPKIISKCSIVKPQKDAHVTKDDMDASTKIKKLNELSQLLKSTAITQDEFNALKNELINLEYKSEENPKLTELKKLLESEVVTKEEFNSLKKELLELHNNSSEDLNLIESRDLLNLEEISKVELDRLQSEKNIFDNVDKQSEDDVVSKVRIVSDSEIKAGISIADLLGYAAYLGVFAIIILFINSFNKSSSQDTESSSNSDDNYVEQSRTSTQSSYELNSSKTCSYCGDSYTGDGYNYAFGVCSSGSGSYFSKCSLKCCRESLQNDPNLDRKWKN